MVISFFKPNVSQLAAKGDIVGLINALRYKSDPRVRSAAARALGAGFAPRAVTALIKALRDENAFVRVRAAEALGKTADQRAVYPLIYALADADEEVRMMAAISLGKIGKLQAVPPSSRHSLTKNG
jgi:HEAT repeat protein